MQTTQNSVETPGLSGNSNKFDKVIGLSKIFSNELLQAFLLINLSLLIFFSTPIFTPNSYYIGLDVAQRLDNRLIEQPPTPKNNIGFIDPMRVFYPQAYYSRERILQGEIPLWNPYDANGMPHMAAMQSAVFSPFSVPIYLFGMQFGWLLSQYLKLMAFALFSYGFFKLLKIQQWIAIACAIAATYCGFMIIWHVGPHGASVLNLPAGLFFVERSLQSKNRRSQVWNMVGLSGAEAVGILGGHVESFEFATLTVGLYILFRVFGQKGHFWHKLSECAGFLAFGALGVGLAGIQLIPFAEYLLSWLGSNRQIRVYIPSDRSVANLFPTIFGQPELEYVQGPGAHPPELYQAYIGAAFIFLSLFGIVLLTRNKYFWFFGLVAFFYFGHMYNIFPVNVWISYLPVIRESVAQRAGFCVSFCLAATSGLVLDKIYRNGLSRRVLLGLGLGALGFLLTALGGAFTALDEWKVDLSDPKFLAYVPGQLVLTSGIFVVIMAGALLLGWRRWRALAVALILFGSFAQSGLLLKDVNGTSKANYIYPNTEGTEAIQKIAGSSSIAFYNGTYLEPLNNLVYGFYEPRFFEALWVLNFEKLFMTVFRSDNIYDRVITQVSPSSLQLFGINYLVSSIPPDVNLVKSRLPDPVDKPVPVISSDRFDQTLVADSANLSGIDISFATYKRYNTCNLQFTLADASAPDKPLRSQKIDCSAVFDRDYYQIIFDPIPDSAGKTYRFSIWSDDSTDTNKVAIYLSRGSNPGTNLEIGGKADKGSILYRELYTPVNSPYKLIWHNSRFGIFHFEQAVPRYYSVGQTIKAESEAKLWDNVTKKPPDFSKTAVIAPEASLAPLNGQEYVPAKVLEEKPEQKKLQLTRTTPGFLVTSLTNFTGWKAFVNGKEVPIARTNFAFIGVPVPAGTSDIEIKYDPLSWKVGLALTFTSLLILLALVLMTRRGGKWFDLFLPIRSENQL